MNAHGGMYVKGQRYSHTRKIEVANAYYNLFYSELLDRTPTAKQVGTYAGVSKWYARKVINEINTIGDIIDPDLIHEMNKIHKRQRKYKMSIEHECFILALRKEAPHRENFDYVKQLEEKHGIKICEKTISNFFVYNKSFIHSGKFRVPNKVPIDKFTTPNMIRVYEFRQKMLLFIDFVERMNFLDEKHIVNRDCHPKKVRADPLTGQCPAIFVSGDFRDAFNVFACISASKLKKKPIAYNIQRNKGDAVSFVAFINDMIANRWLMHDEILIMDNSAVHIGKEAKIITDILWDSVIDDRPLRILIIYLPTRSPELNPIERIFNILSKRIRSYRHNKTTIASAVLNTATEVMDQFDIELITRVIHSCSYNI